MIGGTLTIPALIAGMTLTLPTYSNVISEPLYTAKYASYDTVSNYASSGYYEYGNSKYGKENAFNLFGEQSGFTEDERNFYKGVLKQKSTPVGINIFEMFD